MPPLVSIVIPSYNQGAYIRETIDSILTQDYRPLEIIVMDGASKDETVSVLESYGALPELRWRSEPDRGVVDAVNKGLHEARGEIVAIQSSDDFYVPGAIAAVVEAFAADETLGLVYGDVEYVDSGSRVTGRSHLGPFDLEEYIAKLSYIPQPAAFFRRALVSEWKQDISYAADAEFYLRVAMQAPVRKLDRILARYRYHAEQRDTAGAKIIRDWTNAALPHTRDPRLGRAARAGIWLNRYHYTPEERWLQRTWSLYRAVLAKPALITRRDIYSRREWLPGRTPIWRFLSRVKRWLRRAGA